MSRKSLKRDGDFVERWSCPRFRPDINEVFTFFLSVAEKFGYARHLAKNVLKWIYVNQKGDRRVSHRDCRKKKSRVVLTSPKMNYGLTNREKTFNGNIECRNSRIRRFMSEFVKLGIRIDVL